MGTQTAQRQEIYHLIDELPDSAMGKLADYIATLWNQEERKEWTPNAETVAAMKEAESDLGEAITFEQFKAEIDALD